MIRTEDSDIEQDYFFKKKVVIFQNKKGYRFSVDAPILAGFIPPDPLGKALEVGTGSGIISILLLYKKKFSQIYGCEIQDSLVRLARMNARENGYGNTLKLIHGDFKEKCQQLKGFKTIFSNPPFFKLSIGRLSPITEIRHAKSETKITLGELLMCCSSILPEGGNLCLILPFERYHECLSLASDNALYVCRIRKVFSFEDGKPERFLVQLTNHQVSMNEMTPLVIFKEQGIYSAEMDQILTGN